MKSSKKESSAEKIRYVQIKRDNGKPVFVREAHYNTMKNAIAEQDIHKITLASMQMLIGSPEGMSELARSTRIVADIWEMESEQLKSLRALIDERIRFSEESELAKREDDEKNHRARLFVEHIENHLKEMKIKGKVMCKICDKTMDEIVGGDSDGRA